jgi:hypothetical protein
MQCANTIVADLSAPDGQHRAVTFDRDCGATTGTSTHVSVLTPGEALEGGGNILAIDGAFGPGRLASGQGQALQVRWLNPRTLEIHYDARARTFVRTPQRGEIAVHYQVDSVGSPRPDT